MAGKMKRKEDQNGKRRTRIKMTYKNILVETVLFFLVIRGSDLPFRYLLGEIAGRSFERDI